MLLLDCILPMQVLGSSFDTFFFQLNINLERVVFAFRFYFIIFPAFIRLPFFISIPSRYLLGLPLF